MQNYLSKSERIQRYIREILDDGQKHSTHEIIKYVDAKLKEDCEFVFQIGSYVNAAMRLLMKNENYAKVAYGMYQKDGIPYNPSAHEKESDMDEHDFKSTMVEIKAYSIKLIELLVQKPPFPEMNEEEKTSYEAIIKHAMDNASSLKDIVTNTLRMVKGERLNERNQVIRKYFEEFLSDGKPHKMHEIAKYIFAKMIENNEYNGERNTANIYPAISSLVEEGGPYKKITRGVYQISNGNHFSNLTYSMSEVADMLDRGFNLAERDIKNLVNIELIKAGVDETAIAEDISSKVENSIDNISYLIAFAEDYMDRREEQEADQGMSMSGM